MHAHLHGFGGFVFGILILAAVPLYVATTTIIARTKKPLFEIPVPGFIKSAFAPPPPPPSEPESTPEQKKEEPTPETFPDGMPTELRGAFIRARRGGGLRPQISAFDNSHMINTAQPMPEPVAANTPNSITTDTADDFPLPTDFDFTDVDTSATNIATIPSFTEINFDDAPADTTPAPAPTIENQNAISPILEQLPGAKIDGDFIIYQDMIIAVHDDPDFWIADDVDWFASGKQRPSPTTAIQQRATDTGLKPVLYLAQTNILDIEERVAAWESSGIRVIKDLKDLND